MEWIKKGQAFSPRGYADWMKSHAQVPTALVKKDRIRVYFSSRPSPDISMTTYVDFDLNLENILYVHPEPILELGSPGTFDEHGIMPSAIINHDDAVFLYYSGWSRGHSVPYSNFTGLAISEDGGTTFEKYSAGPIIDRTPWEIYSATSPCVIKHDNEFHMWYCSGTNWHNINGKYEHTYDIKYARSVDGIVWERPNTTAIPQTNEYEAITRPTVMLLDEKFHMWYCYRGSKNFRGGDDSYKIGHAWSTDLSHWTRNDNQSELNLSTEGWDSNMVAYPCVFRISDDIYMLYNGNDFGREGFGIAILHQ